MKNLAKLLGIITIGVIIGFSLVGCGGGGDNGDPLDPNGGGNGGNNGGGGGIIITLASNSSYGWQKTYEPASLLNGTQIVQGDEYTFTYSFKSNVAMDHLEIVLVDNCAATEYQWIVISNYVKVKDNIAANTVYSGSVRIRASGTATNATAMANRLVFQAGTGTSQQPTLTFTTLSLNKESSSGGGTVPNAPTGVTATRNQADPTTVTVSWSAVSGTPSYRVYYSNTGSGSGELKASTTSTSQNITNCSTTATHYFRVSAVNSVGEGSSSSWVAVGPASVGGAPSAPVITNVEFTPSGNGLRITWSSVSNAASYKIYISNSKYGNFSLLNSTTNTIYDDTPPGLNTPGSGYYYQITALNSSGTESAKSTARGITLPSGVPVCFYTRAFVQTSTNTIANVVWSYRHYFTGYRVTIGSTEYYENYSRGSARTSADSSIYPGTYNYQTRFRYDAVRVATNSSTPSVVSSTNTLSPYQDRGSITLKLGYHYQINAETGEVTTTKRLVMD